MQAVFVVAPVFILIGLGWFLRHKKRLSPQTLKENNFFLYWFAMPATLLHGILSADMSALHGPSFLAAVCAPYAVTVITVWVTSRRKEEAARFASLTLSSIRGNHFFAGIPIIALAMGRRGVEAGTLILAFSLVAMQLLSIGSGQLALFGTLSAKTVRNTCAQLLRNPLFMTCCLGLFMISTGLTRLPLWANSTLDIISSVSTGLALLCLGAGMRVENIFKTAASVWKIVLFKLVVHPTVTYTILTVFGLSREFVQAGVLLAAMPVAVNTAIIAQEMGMDNEYCSMGIAVTTLLSLITLPLLIRLLGLV